MSQCLIIENKSHRFSHTVYSTDFKQRPNFHLKPLCTQLHPQHEAMKSLVIPWLWSSFEPIFIPACKLHYRHKHESIWDSGKKKILITLQGANEFFPNHFWVPLPVLLSILQAGTLSYILFQLLLSTLPSTFWVLSHVLCLTYTLPTTAEWLPGNPTVLHTLLFTSE